MSKHLNRLIYLPAALLGLAVLGSACSIWAAQFDLAPLPPWQPAVHDLVKEASMSVLAAFVFISVGVAIIAKRGAPIFEHLLKASLLVLGAAVVHYGVEVYTGVQLLRDERIVAGKNGRVTWCGAFSIKSLDALRSQIEATTPRPTTLVLHNNLGGSIKSAYQVHAELSNLGIDTVVASGRCSSACGLLWAISPVRQIAVDSVIGFHGPFNAEKVANPEAENAQIKAMMGAGWPVHVVTRLMSYPPREMGYLSAKDIQALGIGLTVVDRFDDELPSGCYD